jgi:hypothetical protein
MAPSDPHEAFREALAHSPDNVPLRRLLADSLLAHGLADEAEVEYRRALVLAPADANLQLGLDIAQGATGGFVAFENGVVKTYAPGGFNEFVAGTYDLSKGQNRFRVEMKLDFVQNQFLLTVKSLRDEVVIVNSVPSALNGWKPQANGKRGLFLDCRPGTEAIYDALEFTQPDGKRLLSFDFEALRKVIRRLSTYGD